MGKIQVSKTKGHKTVSYGKYGYLFIAPFFIIYFIFDLWPLFTTFYYSFFEYYVRNLKESMNFCGFENYLNVLGITAGEKAYFLKYLKNTVILWLGNFIPQILLSLLLAVWLTDNRYCLKCTGFTKVMIYLPNMITAASISVLFGVMFSQYGPVTVFLKDVCNMTIPYGDFMKDIGSTRFLISFILFWMWFGSTTILLISGMLGINPSLYEAADIDGAGMWKKFTKITVPLLKPILLYTLITSAIGGLQMYDIPALFNMDGAAMIGLPDDTTTTVAMYIMRLYKADVGKASAISVLLFLITLAVSIVLFYVMGDRERREER